MDDVTKILLTVFGSIITLSIISVVVSRKSQAPQAIQAISSGISSIVAAAVNPVSANYGYGSGAQAATTPAGGILSGIGLSSIGATPVIPGDFK